MKSQDVTQLDAFGPSPPKQAIVSDGVVFAQSSFHSAAMLAITVSGLDDKQIYRALGIDHAQWSRIRSGAAHFPMNKLGEFMDLVRNDIPLRWLAHRRGFELRPLRSDLERRITELEAQLASERERHEAIVKFVRETHR